MTAFQNMDKINEILNGTHIKTTPCTMFSNIDMDVRRGDAVALDKDSASPTEVFLANFFITKTSTWVGLAMKMWIDWPSYSKNNIDEVLDKYRSNNEPFLKKMSELSVQAKLPDIHLPNYMSTVQKKLKSLTEKKEQLVLKIKKYEGKFFQTKHIKEKIQRRGEEIQMVQKEIDLLNEILTIEEKYRPVLNNSLVSDCKAIVSESYRKINTYNGLNYEKCVYQFITDNIILQNISPNFIPLVTSASCPLQKILPTLPFEPDDEGLLKLNIINQCLPSISVKFFVTGSTTDESLQTLDKVLAEMNHDYERPYEFKQILFQVIYSLSVMDHFGIVHNDLHFGNVFVQELEKPKTLKFNIGKYRLNVTTKYLIKFFDWDRAYVESLGQNKL
jgi:hypothetical protein